MSKEKNIPTITVNYNNNGSSVTSNELGNACNARALLMRKEGNNIY